MASDLPGYYFRIRENGAAVFKVETENRQRRLELTEIAAVNSRNGNIKPHGAYQLAPCDSEAIETWLAKRRDILLQRERDEVQLTIEALNRTSHWAQSRATDKALDEVTEALLMAMHDLRSVLVRKKSERLLAADSAET